MSAWVSSATSYILSNFWLNQGIDLAIAFLICILLLVVIGDRHTRGMIQGLIVIMIGAFISKRLGLMLVNAVLEKVVLGGTIVIAISFQLELRRFLEKLGRGEIRSLFKSSGKLSVKTTSIIDQLIDAVKDLSRNRIGALIIIETNHPINPQFLSSPGVRLNANISKELIQTIFQKKTPLHDGAILIKNGKIIAAGVLIMKLSSRTAPSQYGTRHRAAMGITEKVEDALCIVVSEETGSISLVEKGNLNRLTNTDLKEQLEAKLVQATQEPVETWGILRKIPQKLQVNLFKSLKNKSADIHRSRVNYRSRPITKIVSKLKRWLKFSSSTSKDKK